MSGVVHLITSLERGGAQRNTLETVARLHHPARPQLLVSGSPGDLDDEAARRLGPRFSRLPTLMNRFGVHDVAARISQRGLGKHVTLVPFVDDVTNYLAAADVFVLASAWEGLPRSVLEATAAGVPCVVRDTGWAKDVAFAKSITALPVDASADDFAAAVVKKHKAAPKKLPREFTEDGMLDELRRLYDGICGPIFDDADRVRLFRQRRRLRR